MHDKINKGIRGRLPVNRKQRDPNFVAVAEGIIGLASTYDSKERDKDSMYFLGKHHLISVQESARGSHEPVNEVVLYSGPDSPGKLAHILALRYYLGGDYEHLAYEAAISSLDDCQISGKFDQEIFSLCNVVASIITGTEHSLLVRKLAQVPFRLTKN